MTAAHAAPAAQAAEVPPHLASYLEEYVRRTGRVPSYVAALDPRAGHGVDLVYPLGAGLFAHVHPDEHGTLVYTPLEPPLLEGEEERLAELRTAVLDLAVRTPAATGDATEARLARLVERALAEAARPQRGFGRGAATPAPAPDAVERLRYRLARDMIHHGPLEPLMRDPYIEDIHVVGTRDVFVVHRVFHMLRVHLAFTDDAALDLFLRNLSERAGRPVSDARPIVDATMPDGSRVTIAYSEDISRKGPSFSVRRAQAKPPSVVDLLRWNTLSSLEAAYLWLCLENHMSLFVCGEAASGKTTTLNALLAFVDATKKVYTAEDTPEIQPPHPAWQRLLTRESGPEESRVTMFDLLRAALRSRPNLIIVGEIRGAEGNVAFQAMQTGHPTAATFHAANRVKMIQRLTSEPIHIPVAFIDNLNLAVFQTAFHVGGRLLRRVTSIEEIEGFSPHERGVVTRTVFQYKPSTDEHVFKGMNNSFLLEKKIAPRLGLADPRSIYQELFRRRDLLDRLRERGITDSAAVVAALHQHTQGGHA